MPNTVPNPFALTKMTHCPVCFCAQGKQHIVREMMFGTRAEFAYVECDNCDCLYIRDSTIDLNVQHQLYGDTYYSFKNTTPVSSSAFRRFVKKRRFRFALWNKGLSGRVLEWISPVASQYQWLKECRLKNFDSAILDVGCGAGNLLAYLSRIGFQNLCGVDPYISNDAEFENVRIFKKTLSDVHEEFDCIMFHHSFEHMNDPLQVLKTATGLLRRNGTIVIRMPVKDCYAWQQYGTHWVQIDAPRHIVILSTQSMALLTTMVDLKIAKCYYDSTAFQFWGSEQYLRGIPLYSPTSYVVDPNKSVFTKETIAAFSEEAEKLNAARQGDQAVFILTPQESILDLSNELQG